MTVAHATLGPLTLSFIFDSQDPRRTVCRAGGTIFKRRPHNNKVVVKCYGSSSSPLVFTLRDL